LKKKRDENGSLKLAWTAGKGLTEKKGQKKKKGGHRIRRSARDGPTVRKKKAARKTAETPVSATPAKKRGLGKPQKKGK